MAELDKQDIYACALPMPNPWNPSPEEWGKEIARQVEQGAQDEIYLVGHSLGVPAILRYLESADNIHGVAGLVFVAGPVIPIGKDKVDRFLNDPFNFEKIKSYNLKIVVIHGDNDPSVPMENANLIKDKLDAELVIVPNGGHLSGHEGWLELPQVLEALNNMMASS